MKTCSRCKTQKEEGAFRNRKTSPSGKHGVCKQCETEQRKVWNVGKHRVKSREAVARYRNNNRAYFLIRYARDRALEHGWEFDIDKYRKEIQERINNGVCELSGISLDLNGSRAFNSPSIDRIDPNKGYTYDNIRIICFAMNGALGNWGEEVLYAVVISWIRKRQGEGITGKDAEIPSEYNRQL